MHLHFGIYTLQIMTKYRVNASIRREAMITAPIPMVALSSYEAAQLHDLLGTIICKIVGCCFYVENS